jgi:endo-1,4-beta-xylanase
MVDVVNEPLHAVPSYSSALGGGGSTGWDWVVNTFAYANSAFPSSVKLLINDYGIISDPSAASRYVGIINAVKSKGYLDGVGIQCHQFNMDSVSTSTMRSVLDTLAATGMPIYVSELDMDGDDNTQLSLYQQKFPVLYEHSAVAGITLWGWIEGQTWKANTHLITSSGTERPALKWLKTYLGGSNTPTPTRSNTPTPTRVNTPTPTRPGTTPAGNYAVTYVIQSDWGVGATISVTIKNNSAAAVNGWTLAFTFPGNQKITNLWNGTYTQSGASVSVKDAGYNAYIGANGGSTNFGFNISYSGSNAKPTSFTLNGSACAVQ